MSSPRQALPRFGGERSAQKAPGLAGFPRLLRTTSVNWVPRHDQGTQGRAVLKNSNVSISGESTGTIRTKGMGAPQANPPLGRPDPSPLAKGIQANGKLDQLALSCKMSALQLVAFILLLPQNGSSVPVRSMALCAQPASFPANPR